MEGGPDSGLGGARDCGGWLVVGPNQPFMRRIAFPLLLAALLSTPVAVPADIIEGGGGIVFSDEDNFAFKLMAPPHWIFDNEQGHNPKAFDIIYPKGRTWANSRVVIFGAGIAKTKTSNLASVIKNDTEEFIKVHGAGSKTEERPYLITEDKRTAVVRKRSGSDKVVEVAAYIEMPHAWAIVRQSAQQASLVDKKAFDFVVKSFAVMRPDSFQRPQTIRIDSMPSKSP